jgi:phosphate transport system substrate-binding protein
MTAFNPRRLLIAATAALAFAGAAQAVDITGAGASFPALIYSKWAAAYKAATGVSVNYQSVGSGAGIKQIKAKTVTFGASDKPLKPDELKEAGLVQFPAIIGGVVPVVNLKGIAAGQLVLDGPTLAAIYLGDVKTWNDPAIKKLNPKLALPATAIATVHRADGSGTNFLFTTYLSGVSPKFQSSVGANDSVEWPSGIGAKGNDGVAGQVAQTDGSIGYVEYTYAKQNNLSYADMVNKAGKRITPNAAAFQAAASTADWAHAPGYYLILTNQEGAQSWPITGASFILVYAIPPDPAATTEALKFFNWAFKNGAEAASQLDYVPLPDPLIKQIRGTWKSDIKGLTAPVAYVPSAASKRM